MALVAGTTSTYPIGTGGGLREDLEDVIWDLFAEDSWALTNLDKTTAEATFHEWQLDSLASAATNRQLEGDDTTFTTLSAPTRVGNYLQISRKELIVSGTLEAVKKAGRKSEVARNAMKKMRELKNDMEFSIVRNAYSTAGAAVTARQSAGMESWIATNERLATTTASATTQGYASGVVPAPTDGTTTGAMTENTFKSALNDAWTQGGDARIVLCEITQRATISAFAGIATQTNFFQGTEPATIIASAQMYRSDVGLHTIVLHRHVRSSVVLAIDPEYWAIAFLRRPFVEPLAKTGDAQKRHMLAEWTLVSRNQAASAKVVAIT